MAHLRDAYRRDLQNLHDQVLVLGSMVDKAVDNAIQSLVRLDFDLARTVVDGDKAINRKRFQIEEEAIRLIATQQPVASDLRSIIAILSIIVDLERIGDYAVGAARTTLRHGDLPLLKPLIDIPRMSEIARDMLRRSLDAMIVRDIEKARAIAAEDDVVDALFHQIYRELLSYMLADPTTIDRATRLLWVAHNLERIADRVTNICERVVYEVTGQFFETSTPDPE